MESKIDKIFDAVHNTEKLQIVNYVLKEAIENKNEYGEKIAREALDTIYEDIDREYKYILDRLGILYDAERL